MNEHQQNEKRLNKLSKMRYHEDVYHNARHHVEKADLEFLINLAKQKQAPRKLKTDELGDLQSISNMLWMEMKEEVKRNGYSDLTLNLEGAYRGIQDIIKLNNMEVVEK